MLKDIEKLIENIYNIPYSKEAPVIIDKALTTVKVYIETNHFLKEKDYLLQIQKIRTHLEDISFFKSDEDRLLQKRIQKLVANLARTILDENKKIFVVHGRNIAMRDKVCVLLGRLKLDYIILEEEHNNGATVIEKFLRNAENCRFSVVLFSADDIGKLDQTGTLLKSRTRQNVVLELGYFLCSVGRKNIVILHDVAKEIEKPSDFDGIVYEPFDDYGAWKGKLIKEMKKANIFIDQTLADRI